MWRIFRPREYRGQNIRHGFLKEYIEPFDRVQDGGEESSVIPPLSLGIAPRNRCGIINFGTPELIIPQHSLLACWNSLCLRASSLVLQAGGEVFFVARSCYYLMAGVISAGNAEATVMETECLKNVVEC